MVDANTLLIFKFLLRLGQSTKKDPDPIRLLFSQSRFGIVGHPSVGHAICTSAGHGFWLAAASSSALAWMFFEIERP